MYKRRSQEITITIIQTTTEKGLPLLSLYNRMLFLFSIIEGKRNKRLESRLSYSKNY